MILSLGLADCNRPFPRCQGLALTVTLLPIKHSRRTRSFRLRFFRLPGKECPALEAPPTNVNIQWGLPEAEERPPALWKPTAATGCPGKELGLPDPAGPWREA